MTRKRAHIPMIERLASALADKLPQAMRDDLRSHKVSAATVCKLFTPDHIKLHAWGGSDRWWNLDMRFRGEELKAKDRADTSRAAKAKRIDEKWATFTRAMAKRKKPSKQKTKWPRSLRSSMQPTFINKWNSLMATDKTRKPRAEKRRRWPKRNFVWKGE